MQHSFPWHRLNHLRIHTSYFIYQYLRAGYFMSKVFKSWQNTFESMWQLGGYMVANMSAFHFHFDQPHQSHQSHQVYTWTKMSPPLAPPLISPFPFQVPNLPPPLPDSGPKALRSLNFFNSNAFMRWEGWSWRKRLFGQASTRRYAKEGERTFEQGVCGNTSCLPACFCQPVLWFYTCFTFTHSTRLHSNFTLV